MAEIQESRIAYPAGFTAIVAIAPVASVEAIRKFTRDERLARDGVELFAVENQMLVVGNSQLSGVKLLTPHQIRTNPMAALVLEGEVELVHRAGANAYKNKNQDAGANAFLEIEVFASEVREVPMADFAAAQNKMWGRGQQAQQSTERKAS